MEKKTVTCTNVGNCNGAEHRVKVYKQPNVIAQYRRLLLKAAKAKRTNPDWDVKIHFCIYQLDAEHVVTACEEAGKAGVKVDVVYHFAQVGQVDVLAAETEAAQLSRGNVVFTKMQWGEGSSEQMHNKFLLVNHTKAHHNVTYVSTANVDGSAKKLKWQQSGICVYDHEGLYNAYLQYHEVIKRHSHDLAGFRQYMYHNNLNFEDGSGVSAYFMPIPKQDPWGAQNPLASVLLEFEQQLHQHPQDSVVAMNMAFFRCDDLGSKLIDQVHSMKQLAASQGKTCTVKSTIMSEEEGNPFPDFDQKKSNVHTHTKNYSMALLDSKVYVTLTGSTNCKKNDHCSKANNYLVIRETGDHHPVYDAFQDIQQSVHA
eukprot:GILJ01006429.1.p1 GENE.GILJ01006429.1~~GILJ01006429.1.p1  ORF type:complete len:370 (+),score=62.99 GILJ01006429.1:387-1496(+)